MSDGPGPVTPAQLLLLNPKAYVNLLSLFPLPEGVRSEADIPAFELPPGYRLFVASARDVVLIQHDPPALFVYDEGALTWKRVQATPSKD